MKPVPQDYLNFLFFWVPIVFSVFWLFQSIQTLVMTGNWFGSTSLFIFGNIHTLSVISVCVLFLVLSVEFDIYHTVPIPMRVVAIVLFISLGLQFNGIVWSSLNLYIGSQTGSPILNVAFFITLATFLAVLNSRYEVIQIHKRFMFIASLLFLVSLYLFVQSGFFEQWALCEQGLAPDPHNWSWGLEQFVAVWLWVGIIKRR